MSTSAKYFLTDPDTLVSDPDTLVSDLVPGPNGSVILFITLQYSKYITIQLRSVN